MTLNAIRRYPDVVAALLAAAGLGWWVAVNRMAGMDAEPGAALGALGWFTVTWLVMMAAMMLPSLLPTTAAYVAAAPTRRSGGWLPFVAGYLATWAVAGICAYAVFGLGKDLAGGAFAWERAGRWLSAGVLLAAAAYELAPVKAACLKRCRGQLREAWTDARPKPLGPLAMGCRSGGWCIGCSGFLMAAMFALGVMSLTWMGVVAALIALEKLTPRPLVARTLATVLLATLALGVILAPHQVPGLVVPHPGAMHAMKAMGS